MREMNALWKKKWKECRRKGWAVKEDMFSLSKGPETQKVVYTMSKAPLKSKFYEFSKIN